ncbi:MAG: ATP-binding protein [Bacillota bacterium]|nr:ATP-binding protein [Bacillota bacterium]
MILLIINMFLYVTFLKTNLNEHIQFLKVQSNIITNQSDAYINTLEGNKYSNDYVNTIIKKYSLSIDSRIMIVGKTGKILVDSNELDNNKNLSKLIEIENALNGKESNNIYQYDNIKLVYIATPIIKNNEIIGVIFISSGINKIYDDINSTMSMILFISLISIVITGLISIVFSDVISAPIVALNNSVRTACGNIDVTQLNNNKKDETTQLTNSFTLLTTKLQQVEKRRKKFVSNVSHELRTPITSMIILSETIMSATTWDESIYREFMHDINSELNRLSGIITDLLYLVDIEKDEITFNYELTSINFMIREVITTLTPIANNQNLYLIFDENHKVQTYVDRSKFQRVLINIIGNCIKYTEEGGINIKLYSNSENIIITIEDTGIGIDEKELQYIFDRFYRVDESRATNKGSTGLGLSIAKEIIELHNGNIEIESKLNVGTKISIIIPNKQMMGGNK